MGVVCDVRHQCVAAYPGLFPWKTMACVCVCVWIVQAGEPLSAESLAFVATLLSHLVSTACPAEGRIAKSLQLLVPRADGRLVTAAKLIYNDAPWLSGSIANKDQVQFIHDSVPVDLVVPLGVGSLREMLLVDQKFKKDVMCMSAAHVRAQLRADLPMHACIMDLLEVADLNGARKFELLLDERTHPSTSLLNPGLADCQGPAVSICFDTELSYEDLMKLQRTSNPAAYRELDHLVRTDSDLQCPVQLKAPQVC